MADDETRRQLVERAFGPQGTAADRAALAAFDGVATASASAREPGRAAGREHDPASAYDTATAFDPASEHDPAPQHDLGPRDRRSSRRPARAALAIATALVLALGAGAAGWALGHRSAPASVSPAVEVARLQLEKAQKALPAFESPEEFTFPQSPADVPEVPVPSNLEKSTFRYEGLGADDLPRGTKVYIAHDTNNADCLVVVHAGTLDSACVAGAYFPASGLTVTWSGSDGARTVSWMLDGTMILTRD